MSKDSKKLFDHLVGILQSISFFLNDTKGADIDLTRICLCCHRTKQGFFLEALQVGEMRSMRFFCRLWSPWGGFPIAFLSWRNLNFLLTSLGIEPYEENYVLINDKLRLYPISRHSVPKAMIFEDGDLRERDTEDIAQKASEWAQLTKREPSQ
jgi:hypothetical protein